jgi:prophage regulatory protein
MMKETNMQDRILRVPEVQSFTGVSRSALYSMLRRGEFPRPVKIGDRAIGWRQTDLEAWIESLPRG